ncbi:MAG: RHS repeat domain-containing protein [Eubacteriales bacterium]|nr:RHS repeat domain-containing protein [Eubacteriales bacterium]
MKRMLPAALGGILAAALLAGCGSSASDPVQEVCVRQTSADGSCILYDYTADGNQSKAVNYAADGMLLGWTEYTYNEDGLQTEETTYDADGAMQSRCQTEYQDGNMTRRTYYAGDDTQQYQETFSYDEKGFPTKETYTSDSMSYWYDIETDENGEETKRTLMDESDEPTITVTFDYNASGLLIKTTTYEDASMETMQGWTENDYDADGNLTRQTSYDDAAQVDTVWEYRYDGNGNLIEVSTNGAGSAQTLTEYEYAPLSDVIQDNQS